MAEIWLVLYADAHNSLNSENRFFVQIVYHVMNSGRCIFCGTIRICNADF